MATIAHRRLQHPQVVIQLHDNSTTTTQPRRQDSTNGRWGLRAERGKTLPVAAAGDVAQVPPAGRLVAWPANPLSPRPDGQPAAGGRPADSSSTSCGRSWPSSAVGGALSGAEPAGWLPADILWRAGFAALVAGATAKAQRWTWVVLAAAAAVTASGATLVAAGLVALGPRRSPPAYAHRRSRPLGALVGAIAVQVLLRVDLDDAGLSALVTAAAVTPVFVSAYLRSRPSGPATDRGHRLHRRRRGRGGRRRPGLRRRAVRAPAARGRRRGPRRPGCPAGQPTRSGGGAVVRGQ